MSLLACMLLCQLLLYYSGLTKICACMYICTGLYIYMYICIYIYICISCSCPFPVAIAAHMGYYPAYSIAHIMAEYGLMLPITAYAHVAYCCCTALQPDGRARSPRAEYSPRPGVNTQPGGCVPGAGTAGQGRYSREPVLYRQPVNNQ